MLIPTLVISERSMGLGGIRTQLQSFLGCRSHLRLAFRSRDKSVIKSSPEIRVRQARVSRRKGRVQGDRLLELRDRFAQVFIARTVEKITALQVGVMGLGIDWPRNR